MKFDLIIRRLGVTLALVVVLACIVAFIDEDAALSLFLPSWAALFFGWPYLSRRLGFDFPKAPAAPRERRPRSTSAMLLVITAALAMVLSVALALMINANVVGISFIPFWLALYYGWPYLSRRLPFLDFDKAPTTPVPRRPLWLRLIRGTLAWVGGIGLALACMSSTAIVPIVLCERRAQKVHDSIHIGMTVPEVLDTAKDCDVFQVSSEFPYDRKADGDNIPAMGLNWRRDGTYGTYDLAAQRDISLTESEAIERLHAILHDGYKWQFHYTYINMTPMHVSFTVVFGPDGRVAEVKPVYGWD
ncbi:MAG TPA: hypothetical protein VK395_12285 [Gemmataceae bacterium]|nr:hypothetical protein [Gemmataceae bacterium]